CARPLVSRANVGRDWGCLEFSFRHCGRSSARLPWRRPQSPSRLNSPVALPIQAVRSFETQRSSSRTSRTKAVGSSLRTTRATIQRRSCGRAPIAVTARLPGFTEAAQDGLTLSVGQVRRVDIVLAPEGIHEAVNIHAAALDRDASSVGQVIDHRTMLALPL